MRIRRVFLIIGCIALFLGFVFFIVAQSEINKPHSYYNFRPPLTDYEREVIVFKIIGIVLLISGAIDVLLSIISLKYENTVTTEINSPQVFAKTCPKCGLQIDVSVRTCPRCKNRINNMRI